MQRFAGLVEGRYFQPAVVHGEASGPDDRGNAGLGQVQARQRVADAFRIGEHATSFGLWRQVQAVACDVGIGGIEHGQVVRIAAGEVFHQVRLEVRRAFFEALGQADQLHALLRQLTEIDGLATVGAADGDGHVLAARLHRGLVPFTQNTQPPAEIPTAVAARRTVVGAHRQIDLAA